MGRIKVVLLLLCVLSIEAAMAHATRFDFSMSETSYPVGRPAEVHATLAASPGGIPILSLRERPSKAGNRIFLQVSAGSTVIPTVPPDDFPLDLVDYFDLPPGDYVVEINDGHDEPERTVELSFSVVESRFRMSPGMSGSWYTPGQSGHGFNLEFVPDGRVFVYWYVYDDAGRPYWLTGNAERESTGFEVELYFAEGGAFPPAISDGDVALVPFGTASFQFSGCSKGRVSWTSQVEGFSGAGPFPIERLSPKNGVACVEQGNWENPFWDVLDLLREEFVITGFPDQPGAADAWTAERVVAPEALGGRSAIRITGPHDITEPDAESLQSFNFLSPVIVRTAIRGAHAVELEARFAIRQQCDLADSPPGQVSFSATLFRDKPVVEAYVWRGFNRTRLNGVPLQDFDRRTIGLIGEEQPCVDGWVQRTFRSSGQDIADGTGIIAITLDGEKAASELLLLGVFVQFRALTDCSEGSSFMMAGSCR